MNKIDEYITMLADKDTNYIICRIVFDSFDLADHVPAETKAAYLQKKLDQLEGPIYFSQLIKNTENTVTDDGAKLSDYILFLYDMTGDMSTLLIALKDAYQKQLG